MCLEAWVCLLGKAEDKSCWCFAFSGKAGDFCVLQGIWGGELGKREHFLPCFSLCRVTWLKVSPIRCVILKRYYSRDVAVAQESLELCECLCSWLSWSGEVCVPQN